ncbi:Cip2 [Colletotrichum higginsianum IMI 349063]|uniref:(4-O-methyl)-D-glucuronate--lignin esterase n=2 Tax=Colletotrichum higginsianum TaxID=80884 RepID=A0A1B7XS84_COLHI|nr:Cip2 [Colletotrichum higginsianum IMI 349063]OBR02625.1 Cip2 [Colletotrichum higginsianum IMI 349063]TID06724.1 4-O-methyl-glucuronoyl methylesterase [Colletotrichum higginsianum]
MHATICLILPWAALLGLARAQQGAWAQCGGVGHTGGTTCISGYFCRYQNDWYSQCVPGSSVPTTGPAQPSPSSYSSTLQTSTTSPGGGPVTTPSATSTVPGGGGIACPALPSGLGASSSVLPDPFTFQNGGKVTSKADWTCKQAEISAQLQRVELGTLPPKPQSVTASYSGNKLTINVSDGGKSTSFAVTITKPSGNSVPAIIAFGAASIPIPSSVGTITFNNDEIAQQQGSGSRGKGKFYDLYGSGHSAGALMAWSWAVSRIVDALELTPSVGIDPRRLGVTGCSRNGKGAMVAGAFEPRIALTLPQESGAGGAGCWRIADWQNRNGFTVQDAKQIVGENPWFGPAFNQYTGSVDRLPFDHHMLAGLIAPRAMYVMENPDFEWLGTMSTYGCMGGARKQWRALGALDGFGYSQVGNHGHCSFPAAQQGELNAFIGRFLLGQAGVSTGVFRTDQTYNSFNVDSWSPWTVPTLV